RRTWTALAAGSSASRRCTDYGAPVPHPALADNRRRRSARSTVPAADTAGPRDHLVLRLTGRWRTGPGRGPFQQTIAAAGRGPAGDYRDRGPAAPASRANPAGTCRW